MKSNAIVLGGGPEAQTILDPIEKNKSWGVIRLEPEQNPRNVLSTQMGKKVFDVVLKEGKMVAFLLDAWTDEIDYVVGVLGLGKKLVKGVWNWWGVRVWDGL